MRKIIIKEVTSVETWEKFLQKQKDANFLQSWQWGQFHEALGNKIIRSGFYDENSLQAVMLCIVEKAKRATYLTVPGGPIIDWNDQTIVRMFDHEIRKVAKENNCAFIRVRPQLESNNVSKKLFKKLGFRTSPMHLHAELTNQLDITCPEEQLLASMRKATRYEIRKAEKIGVRVEESTKLKDVKKFYSLQLKTAKRQGFVPFSKTYLEEQFRVFSETNNALMYTAYFEKKLLAMAFIIFYGSEAVYHYGASTDEGRKYPGAYLIQWRAIKEAKKRGLTTYNFWGVAREEGHRFANLSMFKRGFGGTDFEYLHAQDLVINQFSYTLNYIIERIRKIIRRV